MGSDKWKEEVESVGVSLGIEGRGGYGERSKIVQLIKVHIEVLLAHCAKLDIATLICISSCHAN